MKAWCYFVYESYIKNYSNKPKVCVKTLGDKSVPCVPCEYKILANRTIKVEKNKPENKFADYPIIDSEVIRELSKNDSVSYEQRDMLIFDDNKSFLLKNVKLIIWPSPHIKFLFSEFEFSANEYFISDNCAMGSANSLFKFFTETKVSETKVKSIKIFVTLFPSVLIELGANGKKYVEPIIDSFNTKSVNINKNNIYKISSQIDNSPDSSNESNAHIQIDLIEAVDPDKVYDYLEEIAIYFQLFYPTKIKIDHVYTILEDIDQKVDTITEEDNCFEFVTTYLDALYHQCTFGNDVFTRPPEWNILDFLKKCYDKIAYRTCDNYMRNIRLFIFDSSLPTEDSFLCCFKFIEKFYKDLNSNYTIVKRAIKEHYDEKLDDDDKYKKADSIVKFRNHYSHEGYYLPESGKLKKPDLIDNLRMVHQIAMNIIFKSILGYASHYFPTFPEFKPKPNSNPLAWFLKRH